jgi:hypothetical protein
MTATPIIIDVAVTQSGTSTAAQVLLENTGADGMSLCVLSNYTTVCTTPAISTTGWLKTTTNPYISQLYSWAPIPSIAQALSKACIASYNCSSGEDSTHFTCSGWNTIASSSGNNRTVETARGIIPNTVGNLVVTHGDTTITASWAAPTNTTIFSYDITVLQGSTTVVSGSLLGSRTSVLISGLTNYQAYTFQIAARSRDRILGSPSSGSATPISALLSLSTPNGPSTETVGTKTLTYTVRVSNSGNTDVSSGVVVALYESVLNSLISIQGTGNIPAHGYYDLSFAANITPSTWPASTYSICTKFGHNLTD